MPHDYPAEIRNAHEEMVEGFDKMTVLANRAAKKSTDAKEMHRAGDVFWRPQPMIELVNDGLDTTGVDNDLQQLYVPATLSHEQNVVWDFDSKQLRDPMYMNRQVKAATQALAAKVETSLALNVSMTGGQVITSPTAMSSYDDFAEAETVLDEIGVSPVDGSFFVNSRDKKAVAAQLSLRQTDGDKTISAIERSSIGNHANFDVHTSALMPRLLAADSAGASVAGAGQSHVPVVSVKTASGEMNNVDNRYQPLILDDTTGVKAGDCFVIDGVNRCQLITKEDTAQPFTNRVIRVVNGTTIECLAMVSSGKYQNVSAAPADGAGLTFLNTTTVQTNVFWRGDSVELLPGNLSVDQMTDLSPTYGTTDSGIQIVMTRQSNIDTFKQRYKFAMFFGTSNLNPLMNGIFLANQS